MNDFADGYDDSGIEEWLDIGGTGESHGSGWGVDEAAYTTQFSTAGLSRAQIEHAERIAREIEGEQRRGLDRFQRTRPKQTFALGGGQEDKIQSAEDALELWRRKKEQEMQQASLPKPPPGMGQRPPPQQYHQQAPVAPVNRPWDHDKERKALAYLAAQLGYCTGNVNKFGNPTPVQAKNLLHKFGKDLLTCLPFPPVDIRSAVLGHFSAVGWDVRQGRPVAGSKPPDGTQIVGLVHELTKYFSARTGSPPPKMPILNIPVTSAPAPRPAPAPAPLLHKPVPQAQVRTHQTVSHAVVPQKGGYGKGKGGYGKGKGSENNRYPDRQEKGKGQGGYYNHNNNKGSKGGYQQNRTYQNSSRQSYGASNARPQQEKSADGFTTVGNRRPVGSAVDPRR